MVWVRAGNGHLYVNQRSRRDGWKAGAKGAAAGDGLLLAAIEDD